MSDSKTEKSVTNTKPKGKGKSKGAGQGQRPRTEIEIREAFASMKTAINNKDLKLQFTKVRNPKGGESIRCTVLDIQDDNVTTVYGPSAGNTAMRTFEGIAQFGPYYRNA